MRQAYNFLMNAKIRKLITRKTGISTHEQQKNSLGELN